MDGRTAVLWSSRAGFRKEVLGLARTKVKNPFKDGVSRLSEFERGGR